MLNLINPAHKGLVVQTGFESTTEARLVLPQPPKCGDYSYVPPHLAFTVESYTFGYLQCLIFCLAYIANLEYIYSVGFDKLFSHFEITIV